MKNLADLCSLVGADKGGRSASRLCKPLYLSKALNLLAGSSSVAIVTGFYIPSARAAETDGPSGAAVLGRALVWSGRSAVIFTDPLCSLVVEAASKAIDGPPVVAVSTAEEIMEYASFDVFIYIERLGKTSSGGYHNMRGEDITQWTAPLDDGIFLAQQKGIPVLAVGDGGNEAGMGLLFSELARLVPEYESSLSVTQADIALPVDVSNWGGYALTALLSLRESRWLGQSLQEEEDLLPAVFKAGAVDGVTKRREPSVDGFPLNEHLRLVNALRDWWQAAMSLREKKASDVSLS